MSHKIDFFVIKNHKIYFFTIFNEMGYVRYNEMHVKKNGITMVNIFMKYHENMLQIRNEFSGKFFI